MAKSQFFNIMGALTQLTDLYAEEDMFLVDESESAKGVQFYDAAASRFIAFKGTNFTFDTSASPDAILTGTANSLIFRDDAGNVYARIVGMNSNAAELADKLLEAGGVTALVNAALGGDDDIIGSDNADKLVFGTGSGSDSIDGGKGRDILGGGIGLDTLTGGGQSDIFMFYKRDGRDVITDFDAIGGGNKQDYIARTFDSNDDIEILKRDGDVMIEYFSGATLTLVGVDKKDFSMADFCTPPE